MVCEVLRVSKALAQGVITTPSTIHEILESLEGSEAVLSLEKSWDGLHFMLTGTMSEGVSPLNFLASGGIPVGTEDVGYGPARVIAPEAVIAIHAALTQISEDDFKAKFNPEQFKALEIYPAIWDEDHGELLGDYLGYFLSMKDHIALAAASEEALIIVIF